jgi:hypothetical protein
MAGVEEQQEQGALLVLLEIHKMELGMLVVVQAGAEQLKGTILDLGVHIIFFSVMMVHKIKILMKLHPRKMDPTGSRDVLVEYQVECNRLILC